VTQCTHRLPAALLTRPVRVLLVGAGGTGSRILEKLVSLHRALVALGHPGGLRVTVADPDTVSPANIGRQAFYPGDVGCHKAVALVNRANMALGDLRWDSVVAAIDADANLQDVDIVIGALDNRAGRLGVLRALENCRSGCRYWLDTGNRASDGQAVLGEVLSRRGGRPSPMRLPHVGELYPELIDPAAEDPDQGPSCSLAEALGKQSLFINPTVSDFAMNILWTLFTEGAIGVHGAFINLRRMAVTPLPVDPATWARFGVQGGGRRRR
jgi:PRTRC genetic system ThiF family protein